jgi:L-ascorbate metabolism protein UlaG (beta-lactamase superfamily)
MKKILLAWLTVGGLLLFLAGCSKAATVAPSPTATAASTSIPPTPTSDLPAAAAKIHWFGISAILYHGSKNIYFDPVNLSGNPPPADLILISHAHSDHADLAGLKQAIGPGTTLIISPNVAAFYEQNKDALGIPARILAEGETTQVGDITIQAVPAYDSGGGHPRTAGGVGFIVTVDGQKIYFAGGTNFYPEMANYTSDVTIYPVYSRADVEKVIAVIPTKAMILVHISGYAATSYAALFAQLPTKIHFIPLNEGPYNP